MKQVTVVLCFLLSLHLYALNKNSYDVTQTPDNSLAKSSDAQTGYWGSVIAENNVLSYSMMLGGYFTLGTTRGVSTSPFDDNCQISYGHPYALTSFPIFSVDGQWRKPDETGLTLTELLPHKNGNRLSLEFDVDNVHFSFALDAPQDENIVSATMAIRNTDTMPHSIGLGLLFDPALGQWGDGFCRINGQLIDQPNEFTAVPSQLKVSERAEAPYGMGVNVDFGENVPDKVMAANWPDLYADPGAPFTSGTLNSIYDLCLKLLWTAQEVQAGAEIAYQISFSVQQPDFPSGLFLRWDMPTALSLEQNILFPKTLRTSVRTMNNSASHTNNVQIRVTYPNEFDGTEKTNAFSVRSGHSAFEQIVVHSKERYEDLVVPIELFCQSGGQIVDRLRRNIFIPATPVSDEGLIVTIDSILTASYPEVSLVFSAENEESGQRLLNLQNENVFLYENENRVPDFSMQKYGGGGSQLADVCFVLDCSGSMGDNIRAVRNNLGEFADSLRERGYDFRVAVVTFSTTVDDVWDFTNDVELTKQRLAGVDLWGGVEDSPAALYKASELSWRPGSKRNIIWVTDEPYPEHTYTKEQIVNRMLSMDIKVHGVGLLELQTDWFNPIVLPTGGNFYNIFGNFRDVLLEVARMKSQDRYLLTFRLAHSTPHTIRLKIHYAGLGGQSNVTINGGLVVLAKKLRCYPNPFNPVVNIFVDGFQGAERRVEIYNTLGQRVRFFDLKSNYSQDIVWNAFDDYGQPVGSGFYIVKLIARMPDGQIKQETQKILYVR